MFYKNKNNILCVHKHTNVSLKKQSYLGNKNFSNFYALPKCATRFYKYFHQTI